MVILLTTITLSWEFFPNDEKSAIITLTALLLVPHIIILVQEVLNNNIYMVFGDIHKEIRGAWLELLLDFNAVLQKNIVDNKDQLVGKGVYINPKRGHQMCDNAHICCTSIDNDLEASFCEAIKCPKAHLTTIGMVNSNESVVPPMPVLGRRMGRVDKDDNNKLTVISMPIFTLRIQVKTKHQLLFGACTQDQGFLPTMDTSCGMIFHKIKNNNQRKKFAFLALKAIVIQ